MSKKKRNKNIIFPIIVATLLVVCSFAIFNLVNESIKFVLSTFGVNNLITQSIIIILFVFIILVMLGYNLRSIINKIFRV